MVTLSLDFAPLRALFINCTLKRSPETSNTEALVEASRSIMDSHGVTTASVRLVDHDIAAGVDPDMTTKGWERDDWPGIQERVFASDILVLAGPIWLGDNSSVMKRCIERLYANSHLLNDRGQYLVLRAGGRMPDHRKRGRHQALRHEHPLLPAAPGVHHPAQADAGWIGEAGPGPSYLDPGSGGPENDFTNRNTTFMTWNLMHLARLLAGAGGIPAHGNQRAAWDDGQHFDWHNPRVPPVAQ